MQKLKYFGLFVAGMVAAAVLMVSGYVAHDYIQPESQRVAHAAPARQIVSLPDFSGVAELLNPAVVTIESVSTYQHPQTLPFGNNDFFEFFFGPNSQRQMPEQEQKKVSWGSGVIVSADGYIITNNHVVDDAKRVKVTLMNEEKEYEADVIGTDPEIDIALIKIDAKNLPTAELGDSDALKVGEWVVALGNPLGYEHSVTAGIVSGKGRRLSTGIESFIQTDTAINFGNSGGPLVNLKGQVIGINTAISPRGQNIGFAVPINMVKQVFDQLKENGRVERGALGVTVSKLSDTDRRAFGVKSGALIQTVQKGMAAEEAGLKPYDIITKVNNERVKDNDELISLISKHKPGETLDVTVIRDGHEKNFDVTLSSRDEFSETSGNTSPDNDRKDSGIASKLGFQVMPLNERLRYRLRVPRDIEGVVVSRVEPLSDAYDNFIREGTIIVEINRKPIRAYDEFVQSVQDLESGDVVILKLYDRGAFRIVTLEVQ